MREEANRRLIELGATPMSAASLATPAMPAVAGSVDAAPGRPDDALGRALQQESRPVHLRSEEHTSKLPSLMRRSYAVFCLKKNINNTQPIITHTTSTAH